MDVRNSIAPTEKDLNQNKRESFEVELWDLMAGSQIERINSLLQEFSVKKIDLVAVFEAKRRDRPEFFYENGIVDLEGLRVIQYTVENKLTEYYGLQALLTYLESYSSKFAGCNYYLSDTMEQVARQAAVTVRGINRFRYEFFPLHRDVVLEQILPRIADRSAGKAGLNGKFLCAVENNNEGEIKRLIEHRNIDSKLQTTALFHALYNYRVALSTIRFLVEACGVKFTHEDIRAVEHDADSEKVQYLRMRLNKEADIKPASTLVPSLR